MTGRNRFDRRDVLKGSLAIGSLAGLQACTGGAAGPVASASSAAPSSRGGSMRPSLVPMRVTPDQIVDIKCCLRPFRVAGPNLSTEQLGDTLVVHNYGHGGSGWSLSWGSAEIAVGKALSVLPREIAVVGCGVVGLTSAVVAQRAGLKVTIYARDQLPRTRSFRASGGWSPDARVSLKEPAGPGFADLWEQMARASWKSFRTYLGLASRPVEFIDSYGLSDTPPKPRNEELDPTITDSWATKGLPQQSAEFGHYSHLIRDIIPQSKPLTPEENPFATPYATRNSGMIFNFSTYADLLLGEFFSRGGTFVNRVFHAPSDLTTLKEKVVIHSTGFAAKDFWRDKLMFPVRGQTGWLVPQTESKYGIRYNNMSIQYKADGMVVMNNNPNLGEMLGVNDSMELPMREPIEEALAAFGKIFAAMPDPARRS